MLAKKIGIDLGTANTLVYTPKKGVIINESTVVAIDTTNEEILAVGQEARDMLGRTPENIIAKRPLREGVIADYRSTEAMLKYFIGKASGKASIFRPEVMIAVPAGISSTERRAVIEASQKAGAKKTYLLKEPIAAAIGTGIPVGSANGNMIVDIGGGTTEVAVISLGGVVAVESLRVGGNRIDEAIVRGVKERYDVLIGERTAEELKIAIGSALEEPRDEYCKVRGRDLSTGLPKTINIKADDITESIQHELVDIMKTIKNVLRETPPELASDIIDRGIFLSGGGGMLKNLDKLIKEEFGIECFVTEEPLLNVIKGVGIVLDSLESFKNVLLAPR